MNTLFLFLIISLYSLCVMNLLFIFPKPAPSQPRAFSLIAYICAAYVCFALSLPQVETCCVCDPGSHSDALIYSTKNLH